MKFVISLVAVAVAVATPALAASKKKKMPRHQQPYNQMYYGDDYGDYYYGPQNRRAIRLDSYDVYSNDGRLIGRDPDPNIRMRLRDDDMWYRNR
jgi:hypothetical protein